MLYVKRASDGSRTHNPRITNAVLCQLKLCRRKLFLAHELRFDFDLQTTGQKPDSKRQTNAETTIRESLKIIFDLPNRQGLVLDCQK